MTTITTLPADLFTVRPLISAFLLRAIAARDLMVDGDGVFSFFYGGGRPVRRVEIRRAGAEVYSVEIGHIDVRTHVWVVDQARHDVQAVNLRETIRELT